MKIFKTIFKTILTVLNKIKPQFSSFCPKINLKLSIFSILIKRIFNRYNLTKVLIVFIIGFSIRLLINIFYDINVFTDFLTITSLSFYLFISSFAIVVHECVTLFSFSIFPSSFCSSLNFLFSSKFYSFINTFNFSNYYSIFSDANVKIKFLFDNFNISYFKLSFIREFLNNCLNSKIFMYHGISDTSINNLNPSLPKEEKSYVLYKNGKDKEVSRQDSSINSNDSPRSPSREDLDTTSGSVKYDEDRPRSKPKSNYPTDLYFIPIASGSKETLPYADYGDNNETLAPTVYRSNNNETLAPTVYRSNNNETFVPTAYVSAYNGESSRYNDFQLYENEASNYNTPSTMTPLIPSRESSIYDDNETLINSENNVAKTSLKFKGITIKYPANVNSVDNVARTSLKFKDLTINHPANVNSVDNAARTSLKFEDLTINHPTNVKSVDWDDRRLQIQNNFKERLRVYSDKVVVDETRVEKKGLLGKVKLGFKSLGNTFNGDSDKASIYIKYRDITKRKFM